MGDHYQTLGLAKDADGKAIKVAYRKLAKKYHPDLNQDSNESADKFRAISEAYETLSNKDKRAAYDNPQTHMHMNGNPFSDIFSSFQAHARPRNGPPQQRPLRGADLRFVVDVPIHEFIFGGTQEFKVTYEEPCQECNGLGAKTLKTCDNCNGLGQVSTTRAQQGMVMHTMTTCPACGGRGQLPEDKCDSCKGSGKTQLIDRSITIQIPPNSRDSQVVKLYGQGARGVLGGPMGSVFVKLRMVMPNKDNLTDEQVEVLKSL